MKKQLLLLVMMLLPMMAMAFDAKIDDVYYNLNTELKTAEVTFATFTGGNYSGEITIPKEVIYGDITYSVTAIGERAFSACYNLTSVFIPNSVVSIGNRAFKDCSSLTTIAIPSSVSFINDYAFSGTGWYNNQNDGLVYLDNWLIGYKGPMPSGELVIIDGTRGIAGAAFYNCSNLSSVTIPNSVVGIGNQAFSGCSGLISLSIPNSVTKIGGAAFFGCSGITSLVISNNISEINVNTFAGCSSLTSVVIPNKVTSLGDYVFENCTSLASVIIPNSVTNVGRSAFNSCSSLTSVVIPNGLTYIDKYTFNNCSSLTTVAISNSVTSIDEQAFGGCTKLTSVNITDIEAWCKISFKSHDSNPLYYAHRIYQNEEEIKDLIIPNNVTTINDFAFYGCHSLTSVTLPDGVISVGKCAFKDCLSLSSVNISNSVKTIDEEAFSGCINLESITLPKDLSLLKKQTFYGCSSLKSVTIPAKIEVIYQEAFSGCSSLAEIKALPTAPPFVYSNTFSNYSATLKVPEEGKDAYAAHDVWSKFETIQTLTGEDVNPEKCATPTIKYIGGKLLFECDTEGVEFVYSITTPANTTNQTGNNVDMPHSNTVSVYAKKSGYLNSDVATENIDVRGLKGDVTGDGEVTITDAVEVVNIIMGKDE